LELTTPGFPPLQDVAAFVALLPTQRMLLPSTFFAFTAPSLATICASAQVFGAGGTTNFPALEFHVPAAKHPSKNTSSSIGMVIPATAPGERAVEAVAMPELGSLVGRGVEEIVMLGV